LQVASGMDLRLHAQLASCVFDIEAGDPVCFIKSSTAGWLARTRASQTANAFCVA
jgi:hypothetical protein